MVAVLKPIEARCVERPTYNNASIGCFGVWMVANEAKLKARYTATGGELPQPFKDSVLKADGDAHRYLSFCMCQWDISREAM